MKAVAYPREASVHELFEIHARISPDWVAITLRDEHLTYGELNGRANQLARYLVNRGLGPGTLVGVCTGRSFEMVVGLLGVLKAGCAYVPLDHTYPRSRLDFMVKDTRVPIVLTHSSLVDCIPEDAQVISLDTQWSEIAPENNENLGLQVKAECLAYVMYTSGSTGHPKGVEITHRGIVRLLFGVDYAQFDSHQVFLQLALISFDAATFELWGALLHGARCVLFPDRIPQPQELHRTIEANGVTTMLLTPSMFNHIIDVAPQTLSNIRQLLVGGEALSVQHIRRAIHALPSTRIVNAYGPTEGTTIACCHSIPTQLDEGIRSIPIGRPIANTLVWLLDDNLQPVSGEAEGEIHIGGDGLARGYMNLPELTAEKFIPNLFTDIPGERLYKTGDLARYLPDGNIEFIGRKDDQIKIRGYRVELGEIEHVLRKHVSLRDAAVVCRKNAFGDGHLIAYMVPSSERPPAIPEIRRHTNEILPDYMVPSAFVLVDALPLNPHGKVDRDALPQPESIRPDLSIAYVPPRTPIESMLVSLWSEMFGIDRVGIRDAFYELGGHSLLATRVISRLRDMFRVELPLRCIFENPRIEELASFIETQTEACADFDPGIDVIKPISRDMDLPLSFSQERVWFIEQLDPSCSAYRFQCTIRFKGCLDIDALKRSLDEIIRRHEIFRTTFHVKEGRPVQLIHPAYSVDLTTVNVEEIAQEDCEAELERFIQVELEKPFDLKQLPLIRWKLFRLNEREHLLLHEEHHLVHDGWSFQVFLHELQQLYSSFVDGRPSPLCELPIQFVDFAHWQREWLRGNAAKEQVNYWKDRLAGCPVAIALPFDRQRGPIQSFRGEAFRVRVPPHLCKSLREVGRDEDATFFMTMLAAFVTLLHCYSGQADLTVGMSVANRRSHQSECLIGMIVNNLVLRTVVRETDVFRDLLSQVRERTLEAYANQDIPFDRVVEAVGPARDLSCNPLFQVMFGFHDSPLAALEFPGLEIDLLEGINNGSSKFDLTVVAISPADQRIGSGSKGGDEGITLIWEFNTDLFDRDTILRMSDQYRTLLHGIVSDPGKLLSEYSVGMDQQSKSPNGNPNRSPAPVIDRPCAQFQKQIVVPNTSIEQQIAVIWAQVLELDRVSVEDNFFDLGGHSLLALQIVARLENLFGTEEISLRLFFDTQTVRGLASAIAEFIQ